MKYKRHKKIHRYKTIRLYEYAVLFNDSDQLIDFVCHIKSDSITSSSLYTKNGHYLLILLTNKSKRIDTHITFKDKLHIDEIKLRYHLICKRDAIFKMQKAFIKT